MLSRVVCGLAIAGLVSSGRTVHAQPESDQVYQPTVTDEEDLPPKQKSYLVPVWEILFFNAALVGGAYAAGMDWADTGPSVIEDHLEGGWAFDDDAYSTNQLAHPFSGSLAFSAARSTGHGFWVSSLYAIGGSALWETIENEVPSKNDMITTPIGGMFIGEAMHRFGRALLYRGYGKPNWIRKTGSYIFDPVGTINRAWWGDAWSRTIPPSINAHFGVGYQQPSRAFGANHGGEAQFHVEAYVEQGELGDRAFRPRYPLDHFTLHTALNADGDGLEGWLYVHGMLLGSGLRGGTRMRGMYGMFGAYDYNNNDYVRASALGVGPGGTAEIRLGDRGYIGGTAALYLVPYGAAGGYNEQEGPMHDHHDGPGMSQMFEIQGGKRGLFQIKANMRTYEIQGRLVGDVANEFVAVNTLSTRWNFDAHNAIGLEGTYSYRRASFEDPSTAPMNASDRTMDFRAFYAITTDEILGR